MKVTFSKRSPISGKPPCLWMLPETPVDQKVLEKFLQSGLAGGFWRDADTGLVSHVEIYFPDEDGE